MLQKLYNRYLKKRHYWRAVEFDELSELYTTQFLRSLSLNLVGIFVPVYLYNIGFSITEIALYFLVWFAVRPPLGYLTARLIAEIGPKHAMVLSTGIQIAYLAFILSLETMGWPLYFIAVIGSLYFGLYRMAFDIDFSKVKHTEHGGKEVGYMQIFERTGGVLGPLIGGLIAGFYDPRYTMALAILVLVMSLIPLLATAEPVKRHQVLILKGFPFKRHRRSIMLSGAFQMQEVTGIIMWPLFLGAFILIEGTYQILGILASLSTVLAIASAYSIGKLVDKTKGGHLLNIGAVINAVVQVFKPFVNNVAGALAINLAREPAAAMYRIPFMKGRYDEADSVPGYRIVYFMYIELAIAAANIAIWGFVALFSYYVDAKLSLQVAFVIGALMSLSLTQQRFTALK
jgi:hypothetical protein